MKPKSRMLPERGWHALCAVIFAMTLVEQSDAAPAASPTPANHGSGTFHFTLPPPTVPTPPPVGSSTSSSKSSTSRTKTPPPPSSPTPSELACFGAIDKEPVSIKLTTKGTKVNGTLVYDRPPGASFTLSGTVAKANSFRLDVLAGGQKVGTISLDRQPDPKQYEHDTWLGSMVREGTTKAIALHRPRTLAAAAPDHTKHPPDSYKGTVGDVPVQFDLFFLRNGKVIGNYFRVASPNIKIEVEGDNLGKILLLREHEFPPATSADLVLDMQVNAQELRWTGELHNRGEKDDRKQVTFFRPPG